MHHDPDQHHRRSHAPTRFGTAFAIGTLLNTALVVTQVVYGILAHSTALLADAAHNFGDVLGLLLAWSAQVLARRIRPSATPMASAQPRSSRPL